MSKRQIIMVLGVWVAILLFLGFPQGWQKILAVATGLYLIILAYSLGSDAPKTTDLRVPFVEHKTTEETKKEAPVAETTPTPSLDTTVNDQPVI